MLTSQGHSRVAVFCQLFNQKLVEVLGQFFCLLRFNGWLARLCNAFVRLTAIILIKLKTTNAKVIRESVKIISMGASVLSGSY